MPLDVQALRLALRARILSLSVCTTGVTSLIATVSGFTRNAGDFEADGLAPGMEVVPSGFGDNTPRLIESVTAQDIVVRGGGMTAEAEAGGRALTVALPLQRVWENKNFEPVEGRPYIEEDLVTDIPPQLVAGTYANGTVENLPSYVVRWYGVEDTGTKGIEKCVHELLKLFPAGHTLSDPAFTKVRGDIMPSRSRLAPDKPGWTVCTITIPLRAYTLNVAA